MDERSSELLRVLSYRRKRTSTLGHGHWEDPAAWGICLVDLAPHRSNVGAARTPSTADTQARIRIGFDAQWIPPTEKPGEAVWSANRDHRQVGGATFSAVLMRGSTRVVLLATGAEPRTTSRHHRSSGRWCWVGFLSAIVTDSSSLV